MAVSPVGLASADSDNRRTPLLELVPELAEGLDDRRRAEAHRTVTAEVAVLLPGPWEAAPSHGPGTFGFLIAEGAVVREVLTADSVASDLLGPGDVAALGDDESALVPARVRWTISAPARVAYLDGELLRDLAAYPSVLSGLLARATQQTSSLALQRAISQLPRVDQRLLALFWHLAGRWGRVGHEGIVVRLSLTHETLGRMVGARRPTVSLALKDLATTGVVVRRADGAWVLRYEGLERLAPGEDTVPLPDAGVLPDLAAREPTRPVPITAAAGLEARLRADGAQPSYAETERRVRDVLERCAATRAQLTSQRERRQAAAAARRLARPPQR